MNRNWNENIRRSKARAGWSAFALLLALFTLLLLISGCAEQTPEERQAFVEKRSIMIGVVDGCRIWEVYNPNGTNPFLARCPEGAGQSTWETGSKTKTKHFTIGD